MKITIDIPDDLLREAIEITKADSADVAIVRALRGFIRYRNLDEVADFLGTFRDFMTPEDLMDMRHERGVYADDRADAGGYVELDRVAQGKRSA